MTEKLNSETPEQVASEYAAPERVEAELVTDQARLAELAEQWSQCDCIALDTEFVRTRTFYAIPGLVQIHDGENGYLIDPVAIPDFSDLVDLFENPKVTKILHACSEDLEIFDQLVGMVPTPLFDTQVAAAFLGKGYSLGYRGLIEDMFGVSIPKEETRSNWVQRPLTDAQLDYAVLDVVYLPEVYRRFNEALQAQGKSEWFKAEMTRITQARNWIPDPENAYLKIKTAWKLDQKGLELLQQLAAWREEKAVSEDKPRSFVLKDGQLMAIAKMQPGSFKELETIDDIHHGALNRYGDELLDMVRSGDKDSAREPIKSPLAPLRGQASVCYKELGKIVRSVAEGIDIASEVLATRKDLEALISNYMSTSKAPLPESLSGWKAPLLEEPLLKCAEGYLSPD
ncbi:MAG: ribonuclease D [Pseudomonadales bacterium]|nr:ribonuclease D [Pseudomonadales bacterium]